MNGDDRRRHDVARASWEREYADAAWTPMPVPMTALRRTSRTALKDRRVLPFVRDLLDIAVRGASPDTLLVFTNADVAFAPGLSETLFHVEQCAFASRHEFARIESAPTCLDIVRARKHCGCDLFAMRGRWWLKHRADFPDMVLGCEAYDLVLRKLMLATRGVELHAAIAHQEHASWWLWHRGDPAAEHNRRLASKWLADRGLPWD